MARTGVVCFVFVCVCLAVWLGYLSVRSNPEPKPDWIERYTNSIRMPFVRIKPGTFLMGFDGDKNVESLTGYWRDYKLEYIQRKTTITSSFWLGQVEVTKGQFQQFVLETGYQTDAEKALETITWRNVGFPVGHNEPVVGVSFNDALSFCNWLSEKEGRTYRLPTEAEWEYACRAGTTTLFSFGDDRRLLPKYENIGDQSLFSQPYSENKPDWGHDQYSRGNEGFPYLAPVGSFRPNRFGLYDMHGNALEYCSDFLDVPMDSTETINPKGPSEGDRHVVRGGAWNKMESWATSFYRSIDPPYGNSSSGFRVLLEESTMSMPDLNK